MEKSKIKKFDKMQMHFHTSIRNVGLYLSISLALLGAARAFRNPNNKSITRQFVFTFPAIIFTFNAFLISKFLLHDHLNTDIIENNKYYKWYIIPKILMYTSMFFMTFSIFLSLNVILKIIKEYI